MNFTKVVAAMAAATSLVSVPAAAQQAQRGQGQSEVTQQELEEAGQAAERMGATVFIREQATVWTPAEVVARLRGLGYTNINDFDVEWDHYEVEATNPQGNEVEMDIDPITGAILDIEDNWF